MRSAPDSRMIASVQARMFSIVCSDRRLLRRRRSTGVAGRSGIGITCAVATAADIAVRRGDAATLAAAGRAAAARGDAARGDAVLPAAVLPAAGLSAFGAVLSAGAALLLGVVLRAMVKRSPRGRKCRSSGAAQGLPVADLKFLFIESCSDIRSPRRFAGGNPRSST